MRDKIGILSAQKGFHVLALENAILRQGCEPAYFPIARMAGWIGGRPCVYVRNDHLEDCRAVLVRTIPTGSLEQIIFRMDILHRLEKLGKRIVNSAAAIERTVDKYYTSFLLSDAGIQTPRTLVTEDFTTAMDACREMRDVVVKPLFGSEGKGMVRICDEESAYRVLRAWELNRYIYYIQEYLPHFQKDIRAFVVGEEVVAAMCRRGNDWRTNYSKGAKVEPVDLDPEMKALAVRAAREIGLDYAGVDLLPGENGKIYVVEINSIPGWRGLQTTTDSNIAEKIIAHVLSC
jgi:RimK family alpha-L-glutamate ligase